MKTANKLIIAMAIVGVASLMGCSKADDKSVNKEAPVQKETTVEKETKETKETKDKKEKVTKEATTETTKEKDAAKETQKETDFGEEFTLEEVKESLNRWTYTVSDDMEEQIEYKSNPTFVPMESKCSQYKRHAYPELKQYEMITITLSTKEVFSRWGSDVLSWKDIYDKGLKTRRDKDSAGDYKDYTDSQNRAWKIFIDSDSRDNRGLTAVGDMGNGDAITLEWEVYSKDSESFGLGYIEKCMTDFMETIKQVE